MTLLFETAEPSHTEKRDPAWPVGRAHSRPMASLPSCLSDRRDGPEAPGEQRAARKTGSRPPAASVTLLSAQFARGPSQPLPEGTVCSLPRRSGKSQDSASRREARKRPDSVRIQAIDNLNLHPHFFVFKGENHPEQRCSWRVLTQNASFSAGSLLLRHQNEEAVNLDHPTPNVTHRQLDSIVSFSIKAFNFF